MKAGVAIEVTGVVVAHNRNAHFRVRLETGHIVNARCGGVMQSRRIKCAVGDVVRVELTPYDLTRGRITWRWPVGRVTGETQQKELSKTR